MRLFRGSDIKNTNILWVIEAYEWLEKMLLSNFNQFPCHFAKNSMLADSLFYTFISKSEINSPKLLFESIKKYLSIYKKYSWPSALIVFIKTDSNNNLESHEKIFWSLLQYLIDNDNAKWLEEIPKNINNHLWQFCFNGKILFLTGHSKNYKNRLSRHSKSDMMIVIQTKDNLSSVTGNSRKAHAIRNQIRKRINSFDMIPFSPLLGTYGEINSFEWKQFWLPDSDDNNIKCPLKIN